MRAFRQGLVLTGWALGFVAVALFFLLAGLGLWLWAIYLLADAVLPAAVAALLTGLVAFSVAGALAWLSLRTAR